jgi:quercetin dioxygenase-like cupin family protein
MRHIRRLALATATVILVFMCGYAAGQRRPAPPPENVGQTQELLGTMKLAGEVPGADKHVLRLRRITLQPGGALARHNHVDRPAVTYLVQGQMTYYPEGKPPVVINPGQGAGEGRATTHWAENTGSEPAVWIAADIYVP